MSRNEAVRRRAAQALREGGIFAFGLSEKEHGADIYASDMRLVPQADGGFLAEGDKYYIGNANEAALVSVFGRIGEPTAANKDYVFFAAQPKHPKFDCVRNVVSSQNYVAEFVLRGYPVAEGEFLSRGQEAWDVSLNTVNVGKFNLGWGSIGICTHALYESLNHAAKRRLFDHQVTDFVHVQQNLVDAWSRLVAMRLFALRVSDYLRSASLEDRRYLLYNPLVKMKVTTQGEQVVDLLWDVIAAKGCESDVYFEMAVRDIRMLPKLEGTVHVNMALAVKFMAKYFFEPKAYPEIGIVDQPRDDAFLFDQGPARGLSKIRFHDYHATYEAFARRSPNVKVFKNQARLLKALLMVARPSKEQQEDFDFLLILGELFTLVVYGQLILENAKLRGVSDDVVDQIFDFMVRDFSKYALQLYSKASSSRRQRALCLAMLAKPVTDRARQERVLREHVLSLVDAYEMPRRAGG
ncbi:MAG TPA: acyl-CoA dehydrogenase [Myxococcales bacterium]|jgi:acyl-CoA dehydrogenase